MELYNSLIKDTQELLDKGRPQVWPYRPGDEWKDIGTSELVLQKDAAFELGASGRGSANYVLFTSSSELVSEDRVLLYGPDLKDIRSDCDFARIVLLRVGVLEGDDEKVYRTLKDIEFSKYHVNLEGYMIRMSPESYREQVRVSKEALKKGISFAAVGASYIRKYKETPGVKHVRVIFLLRADAVSHLKPYAGKVNDITKTLTHIFDNVLADCGHCEMKTVCDEVDGMKEMHLGLSKKKEKEK